ECPARLFRRDKKNVLSQYPIKTKWFPYAYSCLLASSTKARVRGDARIPLNPAWRKTKRDLTYYEATTQSIGSHDPATRRFMMPPITFVDAAVNRRRAVKILPSQLHPFLNAEVVKHFGKDNNAERGRQFERPFMYAVYARYLLARWEDSKNPSWVALDKVFHGAVDLDQVPILKEYEVNLFRGVKWDAGRRTKEDAAKHSVTYLGGNAQHDAYIWCRKKRATIHTQKGKLPTKMNIAPRHLEEFPVPLQLRHGHGRTRSQLVKQFYKKMPILISVNQRRCAVKRGLSKKIVMVNADAMSSISWLWLIASQKHKRNDSKRSRRLVKGKNDADKLQVTQS
ncbi:Bodo-specific multi-copy gene family, putative, partial [Bodo saltans]